MPDSVLAAAETCLGRVALRICDAPLLRGVLAGPIRSTPGAWHSIWLEDSGLLGAKDAIAGFVGDAVDAEGATIGYPP